MTYYERALNKIKLEKLRSGQVVIQTPINRKSDAFQGMVKILRQAFPADRGGISGFNPYYGAVYCGSNTFCGIQVDYLNSRQILQVEDFYMPIPIKFKHGEEIEYLGAWAWFKAKYVAPDPDILNNHIIKRGKDLYSIDSDSIRKPQPKEIFEYSLEEIAKLVDKPVDQIRIKK